MVLLGMDWKVGQPPLNFVGFAIQYREPGTQFFKTAHNRIGFPGQTVPEDGIRTTEAPIQKFRWVHFPFNAETPGDFTYRVTPVFMSGTGDLSYGVAQTASITLARNASASRIASMRGSPRPRTFTIASSRSIERVAVSVM